MCKSQTLWKWLRWAEQLSHVVYQCDYHIVFVSKYRFRILTGAVGGLVERDMRVLSERRDVAAWELSVQPDFRSSMNRPTTVAASSCRADETQLTSPPVNPEWFKSREQGKVYRL